MNVVAPAWPAETDATGRLGAYGGTACWDRRVALLDGEAAALLALGPVRAAAQSGRGHPATNGTTLACAGPADRAAG